MSNSVAEAYLLIVRESLVPIYGEAVPIPFTGQIELDSWSWDLKNDKRAAEEEAEQKKKDEAEKTKGGKGGASTAADSKSKDPPFKADGLIRAVTDAQTKKGMSQLDRDKKVKELIKRAVGDFADAATEGDDKKKGEKSNENKMTLKFEKGADLATTPLLYALARGDKIPKAVLTLFHRSKNAPVTLAITMGNVRITNYKVSCEAEAAMSDVKEEWEATYETVDWIYQNRPAASGPSIQGLLTQGTVRVFAKKQPLLPF